MQKIIERLGLKNEPCCELHEVEYSKVYIGDVLERIQELNEPTDWITEAALIGKWRPCGLSKSLQQIAEGSGYEEVNGFSFEKGFDPNTKTVKRLKDPNASALAEFLETITTPNPPADGK